MNTFVMTSVQQRSSVMQQDAISLLTENHQKISVLFKDFSKSVQNMSISAKSKVVYKICTELSQHMMIKEYIFYNHVRLVMHDDNLIDEAMIEHSGAKDLINQIRHLSPSQPLYDAVVAVLGMYVAHYFAEEESIIFPFIKTLKIDLKRLGTKILARKKLIRSENDDVEDESDDHELIEQHIERNTSFTKRHFSSTLDF